MEQTVVEWADAEVCECCLVWAANADDSGCTEGCDHPDGLCGQFDTQVVAGDGESFFSWSQCQGCGSPGGGLRYKVHYDIGTED
jgi:hypothetical protein